MTRSNASSGSGRRSKVARLLDEYDLEGVGARLERLWTAEDDRRSLRDLADYFNQQLLAHKFDAANVQVLDGEVENVYRLLTDDVSEAERVRVRLRLERDGIDADTLQDDFVTYQAIRTYLHSHRNVEYEPSETDPLEREMENIQQLRGRTLTVTRDKLDQLRASEDLDLGEFNALVDVRVNCRDCNSQFDVDELLERGSCHCQDP